MQRHREPAHPMKCSMVQSSTQDDFLRGRVQMVGLVTIETQVFESRILAGTAILPGITARGADEPRHRPRDADGRDVRPGERALR